MNADEYKVELDKRYKQDVDSSIMILINTDGDFKRQIESIARLFDILVYVFKDKSILFVELNELNSFVHDEEIDHMDFVIRYSRDFTYFIRHQAGKIPIDLIRCWPKKERYK